jgi:phosphate acyltransferase
MKNNISKSYKIALDAMGGDFAPINEIQGAIKFFENIPSDCNCEIVFIGKEDKIKTAMSQYDCSKLKYSIVHANEVVTMYDDPTNVLKKKKDSSLYKGLTLHKQNKVDAFISGGNTGATLSAATILLGRINGVSRPTIGTFLPSNKEYPTFLVDVGANIDCKPRYLYEFAVMASIFVNQILGLENPKIGLLNIGEEPSKGTDAVLETYHLLKNSNLNFVGNIEGGDILPGKVDIVVCDGFTGNIILKFAEGILSMIKEKIKGLSNDTILNKLLMASALPGFKKIFRDFDYQNYGGVPVLGVNGVVIIGHGKSSPKAYQNMIIRAYECIKSDVNAKLENALNPPKILGKLK